MLQINPLAPPRPPRPGAADARAIAHERTRTSFVSAEDFDDTGILAGVDPCESRYWWLPELAGEAAVHGAAGQAATGGRTAAAG